jgi:hypothetical protein
MSIMVSTERISGPVPEGVHPFEISELKLSDEPGPSGFHYINIKLVCIESGVEEGKLVWSKVSQSPKARFIMENFLDALEIPSDAGQVNIASFHGTRVRCLIKHQEWDNKISAGVDKWLPFGDGGDNVVPERKDLAALKSKVGKSRKPKAKKVEETVDLSDEANPPS